MNAILYLCLDTRTGEVLYSGTSEKDALDMDEQHDYKTFFMSYNMDYYDSLENKDDNEFQYIFSDEPKAAEMEFNVKQELKRYADLSNRFDPIEDISF